MVDERSLEGSVQYLIFMFHKGVHAFVLQLAYHTGSHVNYLFIGVFQFFVGNAATYLLLVLLVEETQQQVFRLLIGQDFQLMGIFQVHNLIADVVCCLYQIDQWMTGIAQGFAVLRLTNNAHFIGNSLVVFLFALEETELSLLAGC